MSPRVVSSQDKIEEAVKHKRWGSLSRVHSAAEKKHLQTNTYRVTWPIHLLNKYPSKSTPKDRHLFASKAVCSWGVGVREQVRQTGFPLLWHSTAVGHSEQVHPVSFQRATEQLPVVIHTAWSTAGRMGKENKSVGRNLSYTICICVCNVMCAGPAWTELSSVVGVILV